MARSYRIVSYVSEARCRWRDEARLAWCWSIPVCAAVWRCLLACSRTHCPLSLFSFLPPSSVAFPSLFRLLACACTRTQVRTGAGTQPRRRPRTPVLRCEPERERDQTRKSKDTHHRGDVPFCSRRAYLHTGTYVCMHVLKSHYACRQYESTNTRSIRSRPRVYTYSESTLAVVRARESSPILPRESTLRALSVYGVEARDCVWPVHKSVLAPLPPEPHSTSSYLSQPLPPSSTCRPGRHTCVCVPWSSV